MEINVMRQAADGELKNAEAFLINDWCECGPDGEPLFYTRDGDCPCGIHKHHVHCQECGGVKQVG